MKNYIRYIAILFVAVFATSCEEVIDVDLNTAPARLVIDASLDWEKGTDGSIQVIKLTKTTGFYQSEVPVVSGATVQVANSSDVIFNFIETPGTGEYVCLNFVPVIGETYELTVIADGQTYTASETLVGAPDITSVEQDEQGGFGGEDLVEIKFFFQDNAAVENHYMTAFETSITAFPEYSVFDDEFFNGNENFGLYLSEDLQPGDEMVLSLYGVSEQFENYMAILLNISEGGNGPWQAPPTNVRGNLVNQTDHANFALGYFRLSEVDRVNYTVE